MVPEILTVMQSLNNATNAVTRIQFSVAATHSYQLQASSDLQSWNNVWLTPIETTNAWIKYDDPLPKTVSAKFTD
jgi:hypothetical protein